MTISIRFHPGAQREATKIESGLRGRIAEEVRAFAANAETGHQHPTARPLGANHGGLKGVLELKWKDARRSPRVYLMLIKTVLHVLHLDPDKRRTRLAPGTIALLEARRRDCLNQ